MGRYLRIYKPIILTGLVIWATLFFYNNRNEYPKVYVSTKDSQDTLILSKDGDYERRKSIDTRSGEWYFRDGKIWFSHWDNSSVNPGKSAGFSYTRFWFLGEVDEVYFDVDDFFFYKRRELP